MRGSNFEALREADGEALAEPRFSPSDVLLLFVLLSSAFSE